MVKQYSIRLQGFDKPCLVEMTEEQLAAVYAGKFVLCKRINTKTGDKNDFGFNAIGLISLQETETKEIDF